MATSGPSVLRQIPMVAVFIGLAVVAVLLLRSPGEPGDDNREIGRVERITSEIGAVEPGIYSGTGIDSYLRYEPEVRAQLTLDDQLRVARLTWDALNAYGDKRTITWTPSSVEVTRLSSHGDGHGRFTDEGYLTATLAGAVLHVDSRSPRGTTRSLEFDYAFDVPVEQSEPSLHFDANSGCAIANIDAFIPAVDVARLAWDTVRYELAEGTIEAWINKKAQDTCIQDAGICFLVDGVPALSFDREFDRLGTLGAPVGLMGIGVAIEDVRITFDKGKLDWEPTEQSHFLFSMKGGKWRVSVHACKDGEIYLLNRDRAVDKYLDERRSTKPIYLRIDLSPQPDLLSRARSGRESFGDGLEKLQVALDRHGVAALLRVTS